MARKKTEEEIRNEEARVTPMAIFYHALSYWKAAAALAGAKVKAPRPDAPVQFLYYHAIELYLKALLRLHGHTVEEISSGAKFGHHTDKLSKRAFELGLVLTEKDRRILCWMAETDIVIRSRYIETGWRSWPAPKELEGTCESLHDNVGDLLRKGGVSVRK